jgi:tripartite-type tricarboxylate transporter receptor subunit TctC
MASTQAAGAQTPSAQAPEAFFRGKTVTFYVGFAAGGSYDFYARLIARFIGKYLPGNPAVIVQNMAGAGSLQATNFLFSGAPKDGTAIGSVTETLAVQEALRAPGVRYKAAEFNWIGRMTATLQVGVSGAKAKARTIRDAMRDEVPMAGTGAGSPSEGYPRLLNALAGTRFKIISGYASSPEALRAIESGEVDAAQTSWDTLKRTKQDWLSNHAINILYQCALERNRDLPDVPTVVELGTTGEARDVLSFYTSSAEVGLAILAPPGTPADRIDSWRVAYKATLKDPALLAEIERAQIQFQPAPAEVVKTIVTRTAATSGAIVARAKDVLQAP